jgi:methionine-rich copper-binding protein CopC
MAFLKTLALGGLLSLAATGAAFAHAHLKSSLPQANAVVAAAPPSLTLTFTEGLELKLSGVKVTGADGKSVSLGTPALSASDDTVITVPLAGTLAPGVYTVDWHAVAKDTHATHGSYTFTVKP